MVPILGPALQILFTSDNVDQWIPKDCSYFTDESQGG